jgi:hypothetical protein
MQNNAKKERNLTGRKLGFLFFSFFIPKQKLTKDAKRKKILWFCV